MDIKSLLQLEIENDANFRAIILELSGRGMRLTSLLGALLISAYLLAFWILGRTLTWEYGVTNSVVLVDKVIIVALCVLAFGISYTSWGLRYGRQLLGILVLFAGYATVIDDVMHGDASFSSAWLALILFGGISTMPYRGWEALVLGICMTFVYIIALTYGGISQGISPVPIENGKVIFLSMMAVLACGQSHVRYKVRFQSFLANEKVRIGSDKIAEQAESLQILHDQKTSFFANVTHEFKTPLTLILGPIEDAIEGRSGAVGDRLRSQLQLVRRNGRRLQQLIGELLDLSRIEDGRINLDLKTYDLLSFIRTETIGFKNMADRLKINLDFHSEEESLLAVFDCTLLEKAVANLISNALKFTPEGGNVSVSVERVVDDTATITVRDSGPGIALNEQARVFDRFHQLLSPNRGSGTSSGIGLALVKEFVELHGGTVSLTSEEGFGSSFSIQLPVRSGEIRLDTRSDPFSDSGDEFMPDLAEEFEFEPSESATDPAAGLVLIVDDNEDIRQYLRSHIGLRYRVVEASDGVQAMELIKDDRPVLIVSDVMMPRMDGHELCRLLKEDKETADIPIILITARDSEEGRSEGLAFGADDYLFKPFNAADLLIRVENLIEIRSKLKDLYSGGVIVKSKGISVQSAEDVFLERVQSVAEEYLGNSNFGVEWLASEVGISPRQLQRRLRASTRLSAAGFIRTLRLGRAAQLLDQDAATVAEIAHMVGFNDANYFSRLFKQTFGVSPSSYTSEAER